MTINLEKVFFKYILMNKNYFYKVDPSFFKNPEIHMIYDTVHKYMLEYTDAETPKPAQIFDMVSLVDKEKKITKRNFKLLIQTSLDQYDENKFLKPKIKAWILKEQIKNASDILIDKARELENNELDLDKMEEAAGQIREEINHRTSSNFDDDDDLGSDFDDAESHLQDHFTMRVRSGWSALDTMLGGGFDIKTLNILMGSTNSGKCSFQSYIYIRNKVTNEIDKILLEDFFKLCGQKNK